MLEKELFKILCRTRREGHGYCNLFFSLFIVGIVFITLISIFLSFSIKNIIAFSDQYSIQNVAQYTDEFGYLYILGEIKNESNNPLVNITLIGNFYDRNGNLLDEYYRYPEITTLNPFENSPFQIIYLDPSTSNEVNNYTISANYQTGKIKPAQLIVESLNNQLDISGFYYIHGSLKNNGTEEANNVTVIATIYDEDGKVIGLTKAITEPFTIPSKDFGAFSLVITSKSQAIKIKDFSVKAYSDKYLSHTVTTKN